MCIGQQITLSGSGANTYSWSNSVSDGVAFTPTGTAVFTLSGTDANNCSNTATISITVNPLPLVSINSATICQGQTANLIASGASSYTWNTGSTSNSISISPPGNTSYTLNGQSSVGCTNSATALVVVNQNPTLSVNSGTICSGDTYTLNVSGAISYTWDNSANTPSISVSPSTTSMYTVSGTNLANCSNSSTLNLVVNPLPIIIVNSATICAGSSATIAASGAASYTWNSGSNLSSVTLAPSVSTVYNVSGTSSVGCINSSTTQITVNPNPTLTVNSATLCAGSSATLTATGASSYTWNTGATSSSIVVAPSATFVYTLTGSDLGCVSTNTAAVFVNGLPTITVNSATICAGTSASLNAAGASSLHMEYRK